MTRTSKSIVIGMALVAAAIVGASALRYRSHEDPKSFETSAVAQASTYSRSEAGGTLHMPSSADKVGVSVSMSPTDGKGDNRSMAITLHIAKGWHVNANPPSLPFLIPTTVQAKISGKTIPLAVQYPPGRDSDIQLDGKSIMVYDDNTILTAHLEGGKSPIPQSTQNAAVLVTAQSCSDQGICLPPSTLTEQVHTQP